MREFHHPYLLLTIFALSLVSAKALSRSDIPQCGTRSSVTHVHELTDSGGRYITARGTLRVLVVFASFADDETLHPYWPAHQPPLSMRQFIDPDTVTKSTEQLNLTHYFDEMSLGQFHLIGDVVWVESTHPQSEYRNWPYGRANRDVLTETVDSVVDFSQYDHWTLSGDFNTVEVPDSVVDMIIMVWRTTMYEYLGEASLGYLPRIPVDGKYIYMGYPERFDVPQGSGITCEYPYSDSPVPLMRTMAHELGHWLLGGSHPYSSQLAGKHQYWGMICAGERLSSCMNSYERESLGWISIPTMAAESTYILRDFVQTGDALKYHPPQGEDYEFFYMENHQRLSMFDDATYNSSDRGVWVLHQLHPYSNLDDFRIRPSDGNWDWAGASVGTSCYGTSVPVFHRGGPKVLTGPSHRDQIPTPASSVNWMYAMKDDTGSVRCGTFLGGQTFQGAFDTTCSAVFSPYSNPNSSTWANLPTNFTFEVISVNNGGLSLHRYEDPLDASPSRRYLALDPSQQESEGALNLAWGSQWNEGQPIEADVALSCLERQINGGAWDTLYIGAATSWSDRSAHYDSTGTQRVAYRVRVVDSQGKQSTWSNTLFLRTTGVTPVSDEIGEMVTRDCLDVPYPNPCNPVTTVRFTLGGVSRQSPGASIVKLVVYDVLGKEVAVLVNERMEPGTHTARFDGTGLAGGVYFCRLSVGSFSETRKIILLK
jgi:M6 family metalloprotease-like protein